MLGAAQSTAAEADVAMTERRYLEAAELFGQAAVTRSASGSRITSGAVTRRGQRPYDGSGLA
jgi:hypothetical protein